MLWVKTSKLRGGGWGVNCECHGPGEIRTNVRMRGSIPDLCHFWYHPREIRTNVETRDRWTGKWVAAVISTIFYKKEKDLGEHGNLLGRQVPWLKLEKLIWLLLFFPDTAKVFDKGNFPYKVDAILPICKIQHFRFLLHKPIIQKGRGPKLTHVFSTFDYWGCYKLHYNPPSRSTKF